MTNTLSNDPLAGYQRWEPPRMGEPPVVKVEPPQEDIPALPTVAELEALEQQARDEGFAAGHAEGMAAARQDLLKRMARLDALCEAAVRPLATLDDATEQELARLAMVVARQVVAWELRQAPERIVDIVRQAAKALPSATRELRVRVHPDDLALLRELDAVETHWQLLGDPTLSRGDCILESERSRLDARLDTRLAAVVEAALGNDIDDGDAEVVG